MGALSRFHLFEKELRGLIEEEISRVTQEMSLGLLKSHEDYRAAAGKIAGLRASLDLMEEADSIVCRKIGA